MKRSYGVLFLLLQIILVSCNSDVHYVEYQSVGTDLSWGQDDLKTFEFTIENTGVYDVDIMFSYISGYPWDKARLNVEVIGEDVFFRDSTFEMIIQEAPGEYKGEPSLDYWLTSEHILKETELQPGIYIVKVKHSMPQSEFPYVSEVGIKVSEFEE